MRRRFAPSQVPVHLVHRGNDRCLVFHNDDHRASYLACLSHASQKYRCAVHAYVLMDNHVHLLATAHAGGALSRLMQWVGARYTTAFNEDQGRTGTLWEGRYYSSAITTERYFLICQRYIELNPVRAGIVRSAGEFRWSSHLHNALGQCNPMLSEHDAYLRLGQTHEDRYHAYRALFGISMCDEELTQIRAAIHGRRSLGDPDDVPPTRRRGRPSKRLRESQSNVGQLEIQL